MLYQLSIRNVAIIESVELSFEQALNILTGETGAGKSILIDALNLVLGARTNKELIRKPAQSARVEAAFDGIGPRVAARLADWEIPTEEEGVILSREIFENGRSVARVNGSLVTLAQVRELAALLVDVHGQHEYRYLLDPNQHTHILDAYAGAEAEKLLAQLKGLAARHSQLVQERDRDFGDEGERQRRMDILQYQIHEIAAANLTSGEDEALEQERSLMLHAEKLRQALRGAYQLLYEGDGGEGSGAQPLVDQAANLLERASGVDGSLGELAGQLNSISYEMEDVIDGLRSRVEKLDFDDARQEEVENRLDQLKQLKRKYGGTLEEVLTFAGEAEQEYDRYLHAEEHILELEARIHDAVNQWEKAAGRLTALREKAGRTFADAVMAQLQELGMADARFEVRFMPNRREGHLSAGGAESAQFFLAANRGEDFGPLDRVASGGELSRMMLALKAVVAELDDIPTMIFDEIDSGISGNMARIVGQKLALIARKRQVICITHTAQIAAMGDTHFYIEKQVAGERTRTQVTALAPQARLREISRLVGGDMTGEISLSHAREMLRWCAAYKKTLR